MTTSPINPSICSSAPNKGSDKELTTHRTKYAETSKRTDKKHENNIIKFRNFFGRLNDDSDKCFARST